MRILDNKHDFYDYLQDSTDRLVFDRRRSFLFTKSMFCWQINFLRYWQDSKYRFVLLQCGATFWLILVTITEKDTYGNITNYTLEVLDSWKNYDKPNKLLKIDLINFVNMYKMRDYTLNDYKIKDYMLDRLRTHVNDLRDAIDHNNIRYEHSINKGVTIVDDKNDTHTIPLLAPCGIGNVIDPTTMFCAIEEYFSIEKTKSESTEAIGTTNDDKIVMHGFDTKTSFRGKH